MAETNLQVFNSEEFGNVRTVIVNDEPMFCLTDVCRALEISNVGNVKSRLSSKGIRNMDTLTAGVIFTILVEVGLALVYSWSNGKDKR